MVALVTGAGQGIGREIAQTLAAHGASIVVNDIEDENAGVEGFTRTIAKEVGRKGVTANAIVLGLIDTVPAEFLEHVDAADHYVVGRIGTAADVAAGVVYLVSDEASWVTGHSLVINGGGTG